jgi:uncharacterized protein (DUF4415 family)
MALKRKVTKNAKSKRRGAASPAKGLRSKKVAGKRLTLMASATEMSRPLKKPVTLRLDADVIAWFKREGRRYQTRINKALRKVMEREMKSAKK